MKRTGIDVDDGFAKITRTTNVDSIASSKRMKRGNHFQYITARKGSLSFLRFIPTSNTKVEGMIKVDQIQKHLNNPENVRNPDPPMDIIRGWHKFLITHFRSGSAFYICFN
jgi:hypothetical protein